MALKVTKWNFMKCFLFFFDFLIFLMNITLLCLTFYFIYLEYYIRSSLNLFMTPFLISILNVLIDFFMNKTNIIMKYAGHNRYGMITRFFMFYFILTIIVYSDQRHQYIPKNEEMKNLNKLVLILGITNIGLLITSMILSFFVIDIQNFNQILVKKRKKKKEVVGEELNLLQNIVPEDLEQ